MPNYFSITALTILTVFMTSNAHAQHVDLKLAPNASKEIANPYLWTLNATCKIQCKTPNKIVVSMLDHKGVVNGRNLSTGQAMSVVVHDQDSIAVSAEPGTRVMLQNTSGDPIQASCST
jgi:hypothetical protein